MSKALFLKLIHENLNNTICNLSQNQEKIYTFLMKTGSWLAGKTTWRQKSSREVMEKQNREKKQWEMKMGSIWPR